MAKQYTIRSKVWLYSGEGGAWHFVNTDKKLADELRKTYQSHRRGFGSIPVMATIGKTSWKTSIFPESRSGTYVLPLKAKVRQAEEIQSGDAVTFKLSILV